MIQIRRQTLRHKDGSVTRKLFTHVTNESVGPLEVLAGHRPDLPKGMARTGETVRVNRSGTWAVWSATDVRCS
jgi:hypothetical protein